MKRGQYFAIPSGPKLVPSSRNKLTQVKRNFLVKRPKVTYILFQLPFDREVCHLCVIRHSTLNRGLILIFWMSGAGDYFPTFHTRFLLKNCSGSRMHRKLVKVHSPFMSLDIFCVPIMKGECVVMQAGTSQFSAFLQRRKVSIRLLSRKSLPTKVFLLARLWSRAERERERERVRGVELNGKEKRRKDRW